MWRRIDSCNIISYQVVRLCRVLSWCEYGGSVIRVRTGVVVSLFSNETAAYNTHIEEVGGQYSLSEVLPKEIQQAVIGAF